MPDAEQLDPAVAAHAAARAVAHEARHADLRPGLHEREVRRPEPDAAALAEHGPGDDLERALQVGERDALVHGQALDLVEDRQVGGVGGLASVDAARRDHVARAAAVTASCGSAPRRSRSAAAAPGARHRDVQRVLHRARGMVRRDVERLEVVPVVLDLGTLDDAESQSEEHLDDLALHDGQGME